MDGVVETRRIVTPIGVLHAEVRGSGPAVFCWPSLYCDARTLDPLVLDLARDHRTIVVDGPGHGHSGPGSRSFSLNDCADAAMQVLDAVGAAQVVWLGAAWGGHIGVAAARRHPDRLFGLVVLNAPMRPWRGRRLALMRLTYLLLWAFGPRSWVAPMIANAMVSPNARPDRPAIVRAVAAALRRCHRRGLLRAARSAMFERGDVVPLLPGLTLPVLFLTGADDRLYPVEEARAQSAGIPECTFVVVERSAHQSALEAPDQVLPLLREALAAWGSRGTLQAARRGGDAGATAASRPADFVIDR